MELSMEVVGVDFIEESDTPIAVEQLLEAVGARTFKPSPPIEGSSYIETSGGVVRLTIEKGRRNLSVVLDGDEPFPLPDDSWATFHLRVCLKPLGEGFVCRRNAGHDGDCCLALDLPGPTAGKDDNDGADQLRQSLPRTLNHHQ